MAEAVEPLEILLPNQNRLRVEFTWNGDRYTHQVSLASADGKAREILLESVEGDDTIPWPVSPPVQQLIIHESAHGKTLLGVGQAGTGHWSISVEPLPSPEIGFRFEVACRVSRQPESLGSQLRTRGAVEPQGATGADAALGSDLNAVRLGAAPYFLSLTAEPQFGQIAWPELDAKSVRVVPHEQNEANATKLPRTVRWAYRLTLPDCSVSI